MRSAWSGGCELVSSAVVRWRATDCAIAAWARAVWDTRSWVGVDGLVASGPNRRWAILCSGPARLHFVILHRDILKHKEQLSFLS
jgi:hypothetical protein